MRAEFHPRQAQRLAVLRQYDILDTPKETDFDEIVELASQICETPISVVNLIDADRQWFKAEVGLGVRETPLETSLCSHAILEQDFMEIEDTLVDRRTADNPLCLSVDGLRFYAGYLLKSDEGLPLGTLCVLDNKPRKLSDSQRKALRILSRQIMHQLDLRLALRRQELMRKEIDHRVKNSLQSVSAYVRLRRARSDNNEVRTHLDRIITRIEAVAQMHEQFYSSNQHDRVELGMLGNKLGTLMSEICPPGVELAVKLPAATVDGTTAASLSIIIGEFAANSIKHAFVGRSSGRIEIAGKLLHGDIIAVTCSDDGVGGERGVDSSTAEGLGIRIIEASVTQLGGVPSWHADDKGMKLSFEARIHSAR